MILHPFTLSGGQLRAALLAIFTLGIFTLFGLALAACIGVALLFNLCLDTLASVASHLTAIYAAGDPSTKLVIWCLALLILVKLSPYAARFVRRSLHW